MTERNDLIPAEGLKLVGDLEAHTFLVHDILKDTIFADGIIRFDGRIYPDGREIRTHVDVDGKDYEVSIKEGGARHDVGDYREIKIVRTPSRLPSRGKFLVKEATWLVDGEPGAEWVGKRVNKKKLIGVKEGELNRFSYPGVVADNPWIIKTLQAIIDAKKPKEQNG